MKRWILVLAAVAPMYARAVVPISMVCSRGDSSGPNLVAPDVPSGEFVALFNPNGKAGVAINGKRYIAQVFHSGDGLYNVGIYMLNKPHLNVTGREGWFLCRRY